MREETDNYVRQDRSPEQAEIADLRAEVNALRTEALDATAEVDRLRKKLASEQDHWSFLGNANGDLMKKEQRLERMIDCLMTEILRLDEQVLRHRTEICRLTGKPLMVVR